MLPAFTLGACLVWSASAAEDSLYRVNPAKVLGAENCAECHAPMVEAWKRTHHHETFNTMHRKPEAAEMGKKLGFRRLKSESLCVKCHYTSQGDDAKPSPISGISCESCHNAGADWNKIHSNKEDPDRLTKAEKLGMLRPSNFYHVAANCFSCHTVPEEKLVNVGGHKAGSDFELVAWTQGEVRHNLQASAGKTNEEAPAARKRMFYIAGQALDLEYSLRGLAKATEDGVYSKSMLARIQAATGKLKAVVGALNSDDLQQLLAVVDAGQLKHGNAAALNAAAQKVGQLTAKFSAANDGSKFAAVDALLPAPAAYKGPAYKP